jgi:hypothetical protein
VTKLLNHLKANVVAYLALFVALGGTSYAAINLPAGSVGTRQLRSGAVTNKKLAKGSVGAADLDRKSIAGYVRAYAQIHSGQLTSSRPQATLLGWHSSGLGPGVVRQRGDLERVQSQDNRPGSGHSFRWPDSNLERRRRLSVAVT